MTLKITKDGLIESSNDKIAIVGTADSSKHLSPVNDHSWDIVALGWRQDFRRASILIDIHRLDAERINIPENYTDWLKSTKVPVYMQSVHKDVPNSVRYPIEMALSRFGDYFASSVAYAVALAILSGYKTIALYGIDLIDDTEYSYQRPNTEYLLGFAAGMGISVVIPNSSSLLKFNHRYGYDKVPEFGTFTEDFLQKSLNKYTTMHEENSKIAIAADGARQAVAEILKAAHSSRKGKLLND